jgi:GT2 family glycosyltransferase
VAEETSPREADGTAVFAHQGPGDELVPAGLRLRPDPGARTLAGGTVLTGGYPIRVLRLSQAGARHVAGWWDGAPVPGNAKARALARRLLDTGIAHPVLDKGQAERPEVTVVIPVRDRHAELTRCLAGLAGTPRVIVVDDGSAEPAAIQSAAAAAGASVVRRPVNGGPAAARNTGLAAAQTPLVAFLDSDCVPGAGPANWLDALLPHFADPAVGAVAPRIVPHEAGHSWLARYEGASSTLDMGWRPSIVRPGSRVPYVPGAALVVRKQAAGTGFAEDMQVGEDVDFVWRLAASGWRVRYEPAATMGHQHRVRLREWFSRRKDYGTSAAGWPGSPARPGPSRPDRPRGGWPSPRPPAGRSPRPARWVARSAGPGGRWRCRPRSRCAGCGCRWPRWSWRHRCWTGWTAGRRSTRRGTWPPGCSTTPGTAWGCGRGACSAGPFGPYCRCCAGVTVTYALSFMQAPAELGGHDDVVR